MAYRRSIFSDLLFPAAGIAARLRLAFGVIVTVVLCAAIGVVFQTGKISTAQETLHNSALPMLTLAQRTAKDLSALSVTLESQITPQPSRVPGEVRARIVDQASLVRDDLDALRGYEIPEALADSLAERLNRAEASAQKLLTQRSELSQINAEIADLLSDMKQRQKRGHETIEDLTFDLRARTDAAMTGSGNPDFDPSFSIEGSYREMLLPALVLNDVGFMLDAIVATAAEDGWRASLLVGDRKEILAQQQMKDMLGRLVQFPDSAARRTLSLQIAELRSLLFDDGGLFARRRSYSELAEAYEKALFLHRPLVEDKSGVSVDLVDRSMAIVEGASEDLEDAVFVATIVTITALAAALGTILLTNQRIVERQFNTRIRALTNSVNAIAGGDLNHPITVRGMDEIGEVAKALTVFKETAQNLQRSKSELEKFAYVAAHDLRTPLRAIQDLSTWTMEDEASKLSGESQAYLKLLQERTDRLSSLLSDLQSYASIGQYESKVEFLNIANYLGELRQNLDPAGDYSIRYEGPDLPLACRASGVREILTHLLSNAIKHHDRGGGQIIVRTRLEPGEM
ncbi:MAG: HAMP domain-containing protein, partial [Sulfitobacter sp.]|nr:HAMP domain-containing protein [Sulfitobacter sp.]